MGLGAFMDTITGRSWTMAAAAMAPVAAAGAVAPGSTAVDLVDPRSLHRDIARSIPAVRKAEHVIAGTISTFDLIAWDDQRRRLHPADPRIAWLRQPDPKRTLQRLLFATLDDLIWYDRAVWQVLDRNAQLMPVKFRRVAPERIDALRDTQDADLVLSWIIDGRPVDARNLVVFDGGGLGGLRRFGMDLIGLYLDLQAAAGRYARAPHPHAILHNKGLDLDDDEIQALLDSWEVARQSRSVGYLNEVIDYETHGWNAAELQLTEAREHAALEVARAFGLPARSVDASGGDSMTYANVVEGRRDTLEALRPWITVIEQTLSLTDRASRPSGLVVPFGITIKVDVDDYVRDAPGTRMATWETALRAGVLTREEVRAAEPLATSILSPLDARPDITQAHQVQEVL